MINRCGRTAAAALLLAALVSLAAPVPAHAFDPDPGERLMERMETVLQTGVRTVVALLDDVGQFVARTSASICADG